MALETLAEFSPAEILPLIPRKNSRLKIVSSDSIQEISVKTCSLRLQVFKRSLTCISCGIVGVIFKLQKQVNRDEKPHLNLYACRNKSDGEIEFILMTQDHIFPRSRGGKDNLDNLATMCVECNLIKSDNVINQ